VNGVCRGETSLCHTLAEFGRADRGRGVRHQSPRGGTVPMQLVRRDPRRVASAHTLLCFGFLADEPAAENVSALIFGGTDEPSRAPLSSAHRDNR
jgi:hypothetical protein